MKKYFKWLILIVLVLIVGLLVLFYPKNEYVGTWSNTVIHETLVRKTIIKVKNNGRVKIVKTNSDESGTFIREGSWIEDEEGILFEFKEWDSTLRYHFRKIDEGVMCFDDGNNCPEWQLYHRSSLFSK